MLRTLIALLTLLLCLCGCVGRIVGAAVGGEHIADVNVTAIAASPGGALDKAFCIFPADNSISDRDLLFQELKRTLARGLTAKGFSESQSADNCQQAVLMTYGYGAPRTSVDLNQIPLEYLARLSHPQVIGSSNSATSDGRPWVTVTAVDISDRSDSANAVEIWKTVAIAGKLRGHADLHELRYCVTYMISASMEYFDKSTHSAGETIRVRAWDSDWETLKKQE